jgi:hypothetical protein
MGKEGFSSSGSNVLTINDHKTAPTGLLRSALLLFTKQVIVRASCARHHPAGSYIIIASASLEMMLIISATREDLILALALAFESGD